MERFQPIAVTLKPGPIAAKLHLADAELARRMVAAAGAALDLKAVYQAAYVEEKDESAVVVAGVRFHSRVLRRNLEGIGRVFPFVLTAGPALEALIDRAEDLLEKYVLDGIGNIALRMARRALENHLRARFAMEKLSFMAPGSLAEWPLDEQRRLFALFPGVDAAIGVRLTESLLMLPRKSVSGIYFPSEVSFLSCQLCPRERCEGRRARYDEAKAREYGVRP
jgi:hypothetical protein